MNCCNDYGVCTRNSTNCPARGPNMQLVARIKRSMPAAVPTPEPTELELSKRVMWTAIAAVGVPLVCMLVITLVTIGNKLSQLLGQLL